MRIFRRAHGKCSPPAALNEVLHAEISNLRPSLFDHFTPAEDGAAPEDRAQNLREIYRRIDSLWVADPSRADEHSPLTALCLSGGGIRSATFNLGVLQYLAKIGLLGKFDYLSSVSGGGYIAGWLRAWMCRAGIARVVEALGNAGLVRNPLAPEPKPVLALREFSNYLTPKLGLFSGDTWAAVAIALRNLILNWLVIIPLLGAVIGIPILFLLVVQSEGISAVWNQLILKAAIAIELLASLLVYGFRRFAKAPGTPQSYFIFCCVLPVCLAAGALSTAALGVAQPDRFPSSTDMAGVWVFAAWWCIGIPIIGWSVAEIVARLFPNQTKTATNAAQPADGSRSPSKSAAARQVALGCEFIGLVTSGLVGMGLLVGLTKLCFSYLFENPGFYVVFVLPMLLGIYLFSRVLFVGVASLSEPTRKRPDLGSSDDADREWWARLSGWILLIAATWIVVTGICVLGSLIPEAVGRMLGPTRPNFVAVAKWAVGVLGGLSGITAALTGSSSRMSAGGNTENAPASRTTKLLLAIAGPLFVLCVIIVLSWGVKAFGQFVVGMPDLFSYGRELHANTRQLPLAVCAKFLAALLVLAAVAIGAGRIVNVNRFSLHGMYRNRLVRAYLGASNCLDVAGQERKPDPFTGFALDDNLPLHQLFPRRAELVKSGHVAAAARDHEAANESRAPIPTDYKLLPIINTTLNLVHGENLAWQQRKAESFSMTPLFCGNLNEGYRPSRMYGGPDGLTAGTAITISGAAANPNMGYSSSPALSFLMAIFNLRLGAWLGNTNRRGDPKYWRRPGPRQAIMPLFAEIFGLTNASRRYVNLSDGGHFDNLGLYEVILRRCRYVLVSDAGQDRSFAFEDLGNAIRKIRIDFGINVDFTDKIRIFPSASRKKEGLYCAVGLIRYSEVDGTSPERDGVLVYIKPTLQGAGTQVPYDVYSYGRSSTAFPHESTADQWFSESQFESYRALGFHILEQISAGLVNCSFKDFLARVDRYVKPPPPATPKDPTQQSVPPRNAV